MYSFLILSVCGLSQNTFVPDDNFEQTLIDLGFDFGPLDDLVPTTNISNISSLNLNAKNIADLTGIEDFLGLTILGCENNLLNTLDVSKNINLIQLFCSNNFVSTLDISSLINLQIFWCANNQLNVLDISKNSKLISLVCGNNQLANLDVSNNISLNVLSLENNQVNNINLLKNSNLDYINLSSNNLTDLDISNNIGLIHFDCSLNQINTINTYNNKLLDFIDVSYNNLTDLDLTQNNQLTDIDCSNNNLCSLNIKNGNNNSINAFDFSNNINLSCVVVDNASSNHSNWQPYSFTNYVNSPNDCNVFVNVDSLNDFIGVSYTLPTLTYGSYYTGSGGTGNTLFAGDVINTSQTIYIYNSTVCSSNESSFNVLITTDEYYIPKYFTPNNDGNHDLWLVRDFTNNIKKVNIFDHYGKLLKSLPSNVGWNGTFNGKLLETNDYWYIITFNSGDVLKGHFTLKR
ncbi:T9SS type B sorting domain-containing protein [Gaetbulibacter sp. M235]|uniref:T9SS type B sorting domain-containing protein n=1 Tax=Gaetbulibacter sp. M235 TaxID=3126510 RepID=UPI00374F0190